MEKECISESPKMAQAMVVNQTKVPKERGEELKASRYSYKQEKNRVSNPKSQGVLLKA